MRRSHVTQSNGVVVRKSSIRKLPIDEGNDLTTVNEMKEALLSQGGLMGIRVVVVTPSLVSSEQEQSKITSVNKLNNFQYVNRNIYAWRAYVVGKGKTIEIQSSRRGTLSCRNGTFSLPFLFLTKEDT